MRLLFQVLLFTYTLHFSCVVVLRPLDCFHELLQKVIFFHAFVQWVYLRKSIISSSMNATVSLSTHKGPVLHYWHNIIWILDEWRLLILMPHSSKLDSVADTSMSLCIWIALIINKSTPDNTIQCFKYHMVLLQTPIWLTKLFYTVHIGH